MPFCSNCGHKLENNAKFCSGCGKHCNNASTDNQNQRKTVFDGDIHKCPQCGEVLSSFVTICPSCGYELRGTTTTSAVKEFASKFDNVTTEYQKASVIRTFPIPNTKEDIFEFMILVSSNIDEHPNKELFDAWIAKFEQCYDKARLSFKQDSDFIKFQSIYDRTLREIRRIKRKAPLKKFLLIAIPVLVSIVVSVAFWMWVASSYPNEQEEVERLEAIVVEVENALENKEYDLAMMHAKSIDYSAWTSNDELERQWDIKRDYLIKKIIAAAAEDGIFMQYPKDTADEKDQEELSTEKKEGFAKNTYKTIKVKEVTFDIPNYWSEEGSKNEYLQYYAEKGEKVVMLSIGYPKETDKNYDVSFDGLYRDNENMIKVVEDMFTDGDVISYEIFESEYGTKGIIYRFSYNQEVGWFSEADGSGLLFCFPSESDRRWFYVTLIYTNNVDSDKYKNDYMTLISTIKK